MNALLAKGVSVNAADVNVKAVGSGRTVLATAVHYESADAIEILKAAGAR